MRNMTRENIFSITKCDFFSVQLMLYHFKSGWWKIWAKSLFLGRGAENRIIGALQTMIQPPLPYMFHSSRHLLSTGLYVLSSLDPHIRCLCLQKPLGPPSGRAHGLWGVMVEEQTFSPISCHSTCGWQGEYDEGVMYMYI